LFWACVWLVPAVFTAQGLFLLLCGFVTLVVGVAFLVEAVWHLKARELERQQSEFEDLMGPRYVNVARSSASMPLKDEDPNPRLPSNVSILGQDAQIVQFALKPNEELSAEPGSMCYMSNDLRAVTSLGEGGVFAGVQRVLAGEPFFINTFKNKGKKEGYIALASQDVGDKIVVLDMKDLGGEFVCARDSYLGSTGEISVSAAPTVARGQMALRLLLSRTQAFFMQKLEGTGVVAITGNGTVIRRELKKGQDMVVDARAVMGFSKTIDYQLRLVSSPIAALFGGEGLFYVRLCGPGTFFIHSLPTAGQTDTSGGMESV